MTRGSGRHRSRASAGTAPFRFECSWLRFVDLDRAQNPLVRYRRRSFGGRDCEDGKVRRSQYAFGDGSKKQPLDPFSCMGAHHDEIDSELLRFGDDLMRNVAVFHKEFCRPC